LFTPILFLCAEEVEKEEISADLIKSKGSKLEYFELQEGYVIYAYQTIKTLPPNPTFYLIKDNLVKVITNAKDLSDIANIRSEKEAFAFSEFISWNLMGMMEVYRNENIVENSNENHLYGRNAEVYSKRGLKLASIKKEGDNFIIERNLIIYPSPMQNIPARLFRSREIISPFGEYKQDLTFISEEDWVKGFLLYLL
jgi:hypothetical protein